MRALLVLPGRDPESLASRTGHLALKRQTGLSRRTPGTLPLGSQYPLNTTIITLVRVDASKRTEHLRDGCVRGFWSSSPLAPAGRGEEEAPASRSYSRTLRDGCRPRLRSDW